MLCGLTRILSRIKLSWYVTWHKEWKCFPIPACLFCEYWETCWYEYQVEHGIIVEGPIDMYEE